MKFISHQLLPSSNVDLEYYKAWIEGPPASVLYYTAKFCLMHKDIAESVLPKLREKFLNMVEKERDLLDSQLLELVP